MKDRMLERCIVSSDVILQMSCVREPKYSTWLHSHGVLLLAPLELVL